MGIQGYIPTKDTVIEVATELPPTPPVTWGSLPGEADVYDINGMPLSRMMQDTTTLGSSRFRNHTKLLYDPIEITFSLFYSPGETDAWFDILNTEPGIRWYKLSFGASDPPNFIFAASISKYDIISGPVDDVVRVDAVLTVSGDVTWNMT